MFFDIGGTELLVIAVVTILVIGPKDLPKLLRTVGHFISRGRRMASEFQGQFNAALREAEREADLQDARKAIDDVKALNPLTGLKAEIQKSLDPVREIGNSIRSGHVPPAPAATAVPAATGLTPDPEIRPVAPETVPSAPVFTPDPAAPAANAPAAPASHVPGLAEPAPMPLVPDPAAPPVPAEPIKTGPATAASPRASE
ncbi:Sec-independent protein translocase protein TatB [Methylobrevis pamukkalensis]|uniref:Sec-independent protein translocase protein TatB n=1 Tax=Methylobrevis pamukkalensis TaxID=1439726 RepID=A0A1E3GZ06_9HYPH|nr:Sec-independent protein translocase protein TatB [Methylobrevis pamukkalensis]ODN69264.1 Sec-independent protein translocase protein TatB [Methylobrevis pamukkalensis]